jgi:hypothetical protein
VSIRALLTITHPQVCPWVKSLAHARTQRISAGIWFTCACKEKRYQYAAAEPVVDAPPPASLELQARSRPVGVEIGEVQSATKEGAMLHCYASALSVIVPLGRAREGRRGGEREEMSCSASSTDMPLGRGREGPGGAGSRWRAGGTASTGEMSCAASGGPQACSRCATA